MENQTHAKPHKGKIDQWFKLPCTSGLGYMVCGDSIDHPEFGGGDIRTSYVVKHDGNEIETKNSRYTLGDPAKI